MSINTNLTLRKVRKQYKQEFWIVTGQYEYISSYRPNDYQIKTARVRKVQIPTLDKWVSKYGADVPLYQVLLALGWIIPKSGGKGGTKVKFANDKLAKDYQEQAEKREKGTDEVTDTSDDPQDGDKHGGDGNSQECDAPAEKASEDAEGQPNGSPSESPNKEITDEELDKLLEGLEEGVDIDGSPERRGYEMNVEPLIRKAQQDLKKKDAKPLRRLINTMEKLFLAEIGTQGQQSPRYNAKRLVTEIVSNRYNLNRAHKEEMGKRPILLMVDTSGSCSSHAGGNLEAAILIQERMPEAVTLIVHANGYPNAVIGKHIEMPNKSERQDLGAYYTSVDWSLVINLGDRDAEIEMLACQEKGAKIVLLDSYRAKAGKAFIVKETTYPHIGGVNDTTDAWIALNMYKKAFV